MKIDEADSVQYHDLSSKVSDVIEERHTERDDDTGEYTFTGNNECTKQCKRAKL